MSPALKITVLTALCAVAAACATRADDPLNPTFGQAVASMDSQIIPPAPDSGPMLDSGARAALAIRRLEKDKVKQPQTQSTSTVAGALGAGGALQGDAP